MTATNVWAPAPTLTDLTLHALAVHRMLTAEQLRQMFTPTKPITATYLRLGELRKAGLAAELPRRNRHQPKVWYATGTGLDRALADPDLTRRYQVDPARHQMLVAHTLAVNDVGIAFATHARRTGDDCDFRSWEHEVAHALGADAGAVKGRNTLVVDAVLSYAIPSADGTTEKLVRRFIELDRATETVERLRDKLRRYGAYYSAGPRPAPGRPVPSNPNPWWTRRYTSFPPVLVVIGANPTKPDAAFHRRIAVLRGLAADDPSITCPVLAATLTDLSEHGPAALIWWRVDTPTDTPCDFLGRV